MKFEKITEFSEKQKQPNDEIQDFSGWIKYYIENLIYNTSEDLIYKKLSNLKINLNLDDTLDIIENKNINDWIRIRLIYNIKDINFNQIKKLIFDDITEIHILEMIINRLEKKLELEQIIEILMDDDFSLRLKIALIREIESIESMNDLKLINKLLNNNNSKYIKEWLEKQITTKIKYNSRNIKLIEEIWLIWNILFNVKSEKSDIFNDLIEDIRENKSKSLYEIMKNKTNVEFSKLQKEFKQYSNQEILNNWEKIINYQKHNANIYNIGLVKKIGIEKNKLDLSIYVRYWHVVDYPEIAEYIILFLDKYIKWNYSKYFSWIRIVPRKKNLLPSLKIIENLNVFDVEWMKMLFETSLHTNAIPFFLSHSTNSNIHWTPNIVSSSMKERKNDIKSHIELEKNHDSWEYTKKYSLENLFREIIRNIIYLEIERDKIQLKTN